MGLGGDGEIPACGDLCVPTAVRSPFDFPQDERTVQAWAKQWSWCAGGRTDCPGLGYAMVLVRGRTNGRSRPGLSNGLGAREGERTAQAWAKQWSWCAGGRTDEIPGLGYGNGLGAREGERTARPRLSNGLGAREGEWRRRGSGREIPACGDFCAATAVGSPFEFPQDRPFDFPQGERTGQPKPMPILIDGLMRGRTNGQPRPG